MPLIEGFPLVEDDTGAISRAIIDSVIQTGTTNEYAYGDATSQSISDGSSYTTGSILSLSTGSQLMVLAKPFGTGLTVDVSVDGGSTWPITNEPVNEYIDLEQVSGGDVAIRFNNDTGSSVTLDQHGAMGWP